MTYIKALIIIFATLFALTGCDNGDDDTRTYSESDIWGVWEAAKVPAPGGLEAQGVELRISQNRILQKADRLIKSENNEIVVENTHACLGFGELAVEDAALGTFNFYWVENLSFPSQASDNIKVELTEDGARAFVSTKAFNADGSETFLEYELERTSSDVPDIDETSCTSQE